MATFSPQARYVSGQVLAVDYTPTEDVNAGDIVIVGIYPYYAPVDIAADALGTITCGGVADVVKKDGDTGADRSLWYWDATEEEATTTSAGNTFLGVSIGSVASGDATVRIEWSPIPLGT